MKNTIRIIGFAIVAGLLVASASGAKPPKCPTCKMTLSAKRDKNHPIEVTLGKKKFYCARCKSHKPKIAKPAGGPFPR